MRFGRLTVEKAPNCYQLVTIMASRLLPGFAVAGLNKIRKLPNFTIYCS
jgi:hypothetical protein